MKVLKFFLGLALIGLIWCDASDASDASNDIETIKTLVMQIFQWYKNEMTTIRSEPIKIGDSCFMAGHTCS